MGHRVTGKNEIKFLEMLTWFLGGIIHIMYIS